MQLRQPEMQNGETVQQPRTGLVTLAAATAAFATYTSMYAFRRPFTVATYEDLTLWGADYKSVAVAVQILGYMMSKFVGIKVVSETPAARRVTMILGLIGISAFGLLVFAVLPAPWNVVGLLVNGLPLGMIWGLVFGFLEGRRVTEFLGLGMSLSVIFASGWVKSAGGWLLRFGVPEFWMPLVTGLLFVPLLLVAAAVLGRMPPPDAADQAARMARHPMDKRARREFLRRWWPGIVCFTGAYLCLMTYRDVRDTFMAEVLKEQGYRGDPGVFSGLETIVGCLVIVSLFWLRWVQDNRKALIANAMLIVAGPVIAAVGTWLFQQGLLGPQAWLVATGFGTYLAFVPFQSLMYDRLLAVLRHAGTAAFLISIGDAFGYLSTVAIYLSRFVEEWRMPWSLMLMEGSYVQAVLVAVLTVAGACYFLKPRARREQ